MRRLYELKVHQPILPGVTEKSRTVRIATEVVYEKLMIATVKDYGHKPEALTCVIQDLEKNFEPQCSPETPDYWLPTQWREFQQFLRFGSTPLRE